VATMYRALKDATLAGTLEFIKADANDTLMRRRVRPKHAIAWAESRGVIPPGAFDAVRGDSSPFSEKTSAADGVSVPCFEREVRPLAVPAGLLALPPETIVQWKHYSGVAQAQANAVRTWIEEVIARQAEGFFTVEEATHELARMRSGIPAQRWAARMRQAQRAKEPDDRLAIRDRGTRLPMAPTEPQDDFFDLVKPADIDAWLQRMGTGFAFPNPAPGTSKTVPKPVQRGQIEPYWVKPAQERARAIIKRKAERDLFPSQQDIADEIAKDFRKEGIFGVEGKPLTGSTIKRHALKGIGSGSLKARSTKLKQGK
jgi:hypothetical protein